MKNGDELYVLKEVEGVVEHSEQIGFIFVLLKDYSVAASLNQSMVKDEDF